jgi:hypothetical protein
VNSEKKIHFKKQEKKIQFQFYFSEILNPSIRISRVSIFRIRKKMTNNNNCNYGSNNQQQQEAVGSYFLGPAREASNMKEENMEEDTEDEEATAGYGTTGTWVGPAVGGELVRMEFLFSFFFFFFPDLGDFKILLILLIINVNGELFFFFF